jgi:primosomal protein N' (replication factor Y)
VLHSYLAVGDRRATGNARGAATPTSWSAPAVFLARCGLGLVIVRETRSRLKQSEQIRYHGARHALARAQATRSRCSAGDPGLESFANAERKLRLLTLPERIDGRPLPVVEIVDLNEAPPAAAVKSGRGQAPGRPVPPALLDGLAACLCGSRRSCS